MINETLLIQEINKLKTQISLLSNELNIIKNKINKATTVTDLEKFFLKLMI